MVSRVIPVDPFDLVIFGGTGDLARRKILPALFRRYLSGQIPQEARIVGAARGELGRDGFQAMVREAVCDFGQGAADRVALEAFLDAVHYVQIDATGAGGWSDLAAILQADRVRAFYFSVAPSLFGPLAERIHAHGMAGRNVRIVVEKPFGHDLASAQALNATLDRKSTRLNSSHITT